MPSPFVTGIEIVAKKEPSGVVGAHNVLGPDGINHTIYFRLQYAVGTPGAWQPLPFVDEFPA